MSADKAKIRSLMREREKSFSRDILVTKSEKIMRGVESLPQFLEARTVLLYMSIPGEVETAEFIRRWADKKRIAIPLVKGAELELRLYDPAKLIQGYHGIQEPSSETEIIAPDEVDFALVPGVAFEQEKDDDSASEKVWRLGRGKGFYDRLIPRLSCPVFGIAFGFRLIDSLPRDPWDAPLDGIVTNQEF